MDDDRRRVMYSIDEALLMWDLEISSVLFLFMLGWFVCRTMEMMILSFIGQAVKSEWKLSSTHNPFNKCCFAGLLLGSFFWGFVSDHYGRRHGFLGIALVASVTGLLSAFSPNYLSLVILRGLVGFGLGSGPVFLSWFLEFVPASSRGLWMVVISIFWTLGTISEAALAWIVMPRLNWRWLLALSSVPSFAVLLFHGLSPESPRIDEEFVNADHTPLLFSTTNKTTVVKSGFSSFSRLLSSRLIRTTFLLWVLFFGNSFLYYGIILLTSELSSGKTKCGSTLLLLGDSQDASLYINVFVTSLAELPGLLFSAVIVDRVGRKVSMTIMSILTFIFLLPLVIIEPVTLTTGFYLELDCSLMEPTQLLVFMPQRFPLVLFTVFDRDNLLFLTLQSIIACLTALAYKYIFLTQSKCISNFYKVNWFWDCKCSGKNWWDGMPSRSRWIGE
ncbi:hypothetical protein LWI28_002796 [Acer negundo]|uniref:Major facilitator superfamily (MFS) profile domain-containing protein n=1 Tax=Acer negundo TaxID=4023 RepID=A0AAD5J800_ACENE|nr:hypothetical protein LWI28_002796 [Acer negundo]